MISSIFNTVIFNPLYNGLIFLIEKLPFVDAGIVVIVFTVITKFILLPLSIKASKSQIQMKSIEKDLEDVKNKYKDNKEVLAQKTIELYKEKGINPFVGIFILIIQLPIVIGLYQVFIKSGLPEINTNILYSFVAVPEYINMMFLNIVNISDKSIILAIVAGLTTFVQIKLATDSNKPNPSAKNSLQNDIARAMSVQMKYIFPVIVIFISYSISAALSLYWITSNIFSIIQEVYIKKKYHKTPPVVV